MLEREYTSQDTVSLSIQHLEPKDGDVIIVTFPNDVLREQMDLFAQGLNENLKATGNIADVTILCVKGDVNVNLVTEEVLNEAGYYRAVPKELQN